MNNVNICVGRRASNPFTPKFSEFSLYSIEELCYYFIERCYVIHEEVICVELVDWIRDECGLKELALKIESDVRKKLSPAVIVPEILEYVGAYDEDTIRKVEKILREQANLRPLQRWKKRADYYYQMGRFRQAFEIYFYCLKNLSEDDTEDKAILYYDLASIFALDFDYTKACEYYEKSYGLRPQRQTRVAFILAKKMQLNDYSFGAFMRENPQWKDEFEEASVRFENIKNQWEESHTKEVYEKVCKDFNGKKELIKNLKKDYRRQTYLNR